MNRVEISARDMPLPPWAGAADRYVLKVLGALGRDGWELSVVFCGNAFIRELNAAASMIRGLSRGVSCMGPLKIISLETILIRGTEKPPATSSMTRRLKIT